VLRQTCVVWRFFVKFLSISATNAALCIDPIAHPTGPMAHPIGPMPHPSGPMPHPIGPKPHPTGPMAHPISPMAHPISPMAHPIGPMPRPTGSTRRSIEPMRRRGCRKNWHGGRMPRRGCRTRFRAAPLRSRGHRTLRRSVSEGGDELHFRGAGVHSANRVVLTKNPRGWTRKILEHVDRMSFETLARSAPSKKRAVILSGAKAERRA